MLFPHQIFLQYAGQKFPDLHPTKVVSRAYAEIDGNGAIQDGDIFFHQIARKYSTYQHNQTTHKASSAPI